jgi:hypothetical protein
MFKEQIIQLDRSFLNMCYKNSFCQLIFSDQSAKWTTFTLQFASTTHSVLTIKLAWLISSGLNDQTNMPNEIHIAVSK